MFGWPVRTFEAAVNPERLGWGWAMFAYRSWQRLSAVDRVLARALPQRLFYNVLLTGTRPELSRGRDPRQVPLRRVRVAGAACAGSCATGRGRRSTWCATGGSCGCGCATRDVVTEGFVFLGRRVEITAAARATAAIVLGRWVHLGDDNRLRAHEGTLRIGDKTRVRPRQHAQLLPRHRVRAALHRRGLGLRLRLRPPLRRPPPAHQGPGHREVAGAHRRRRVGRRQGVGAARRPGRRRQRAGRAHRRAGRDPGRQRRRRACRGGWCGTGPPGTPRAAEHRAALADMARKHQRAGRSR